jgi:hypothetical protein
MKIPSWSKDGGPDSPVDGFFLIEIKSLFSIVLLRFNEGCREAHHSHAFHALTWFIRGDLVEEDINGEYHVYERSIIPKVTRRSKNHRVIAWTDSWCLSIRGPWKSTWTEDTDTHHTVLTHGRKIVERTEK